ncbi:MAG: putative sugar O-methyltransferase [Sphingosinicella sp.]
MLADMENADDMFRPTNFWASGLKSIIDDLINRGFDNFREHPSAHVYYVPIYRSASWERRLSRFSVAVAAIDRMRPQSRLKRRLEALATGEAEAFMDYRLFKAGDVPGGLNLAQVSEQSVGGGERFNFEGTQLSRSMLRYLRGLAFLKKHTDSSAIRAILEIGGGYGTLGEILLKARPDSFYVDVDIPPVAAVATYYLQQVFGQDAVLTYETSRDLVRIELDEIRRSYSAAVLCPWQLPRISGSIDLFANFISFQEMEPDVVRNYSALVQQHTTEHILLHNSVVGMNVAPAGEMGVLKPTTTDDMVSYFDQFELQARDSIGLGQAFLHDPFRSEHIYMARKRRA